MNALFTTMQHTMCATLFSLPVTSYTLWQRAPKHLLTHRTCIAQSAAQRLAESSGAPRTAAPQSANWKRLVSFLRLFPSIIWLTIAVSLFVPMSR